MTKAMKYTCGLLTIAFAVGAYLFLGLAYPYHIHFQEQYQLFQSTGAYFREVAGMPGGFADYLGRYFTQFFYSAWGGAATITAVLVCIQLLTWGIIKRKTMLLYALSFLPSLALLVFMCDENALLGASIAILLAEAAAFGFSFFERSDGKSLIALALIPILYYLCGGLAFVYVISLAISERQFWFICAAALLTLLCPVVGHWFDPYVHSRMFFGIHYYRLHEAVALWPWISVGIVAVLVLLGEIEFPHLKSGAAFTIGILGFLGVCGIGTMGVLKAADMEKEECMKYDYMVRTQNWSRIVAMADQKNPSAPMAVSCLNLALAQTGAITDHMFEYDQIGPEGLVTKDVKDHVASISSAETYYYLGMVNAAQRLFYQSQEFIPDFQRSARLQKRLVETNLINGDYYVARKFLGPLKHAKNYRKWAYEIEELLDNPTLIDQHPEYGKLRQARHRKSEFMFNETHTEVLLSALYQENRDNKLALQCLHSCTLLNKDLQLFYDNLNLFKENFEAKPYQEAVALYWALNRDGMEGVPSYVTNYMINRCQKFLEDRKTKDEAYMRKTYGDSYWFYYYYEYKG